MALRSYKALLNGGDHTVSARAFVGALRCALALFDDREVSVLSAYWETLTTVEAGELVVDIVVPLMLQGRIVPAMEVARAEAARRPTGRSCYLKARAQMLAGLSSEDAFRMAADLADAADDIQLATAARSRQLEEMLLRHAPAQELTRVAESIALPHATAAMKLLVARVKLAAASRFSRAAGLSLLEEAAVSEDQCVARAAMHAAASHADAMDRDLSWVEGDRIEAALAHWPDEEQRGHALARHALRVKIAESDDPDGLLAEAAGLADGYRRHLEQARATLAGYSFDSEPPAGNHELVMADLCLRALGEVQRGEARVAELTLRRLLVELEGGAHAAPAGAWLVAGTATASAAKNVALTGLELMAALEPTFAGTPPQGWGWLAALALRQRATELGERLLRRAVAGNEPGARERLSEALVARAWRGMDVEPNEAVMTLLLEARSLATPFM